MIMIAAAIHLKVVMLAFFGYKSEKKHPTVWLRRSGEAGPACLAGMRLQFILYPLGPVKAEAKQMGFSQNPHALPG